MSVIVGVNGDGGLAVRVDRLSRDSTMARMIRMVEESRSRQGASQRFARRFTRIYVPFILVGTVLLIVVPQGVSGAEFGPPGMQRCLTVLPRS